MSIDQIQELKSVIMSFRVSELTQLLAFCNQSKFGRKSVLQERALQLLKKDNLTQQVQFKIRELSLKQGNPLCLQKSINETPVLDSSSNECTITEPEMSHTINSYTTNVTKPHNEYYSMPKFDLGLTGCTSSQSINKLNSYHSTRNVRFKSIPFDDIVCTLVEPTLLPAINKTRLNSYDCSFKLKPEEANEISTTREFRNNKFEFNSQIHLRFCHADTYAPQEDFLPVNLNVKLNFKNIPLPIIIPNNKPNAELKRQSKPIDLTPFCKLSPIANNYLNISWNQDQNQKNFCFTIYLAKKLTSKDLLDKLHANGIEEPIVTQIMIMNKLTDTDNEISTTSLKGNLNCPLGKMRLRIPVRSRQCNHIQCFDAELYLQMNEKKPSWLCPVCDLKAEYKTLFIDGLFTQILKEAPADSNEIEFTEDGGWKVVQSSNKTVTLTPQRRKIEEADASSIKKPKPDDDDDDDDVIELSSDSEDENDKQNDNDNNENQLQTQGLHMPKLSFSDTSHKSSSLNSLNAPFPQFASALSSLCTQSASSENTNRSSSHSRNLITRPNLTATGTSNFGNLNFGTFPIGSSTNANLSEVISLD